MHDIFDNVAPEIILNLGSLISDLKEKVVAGKFMLCQIISVSLLNEVQAKTEICNELLV